VEAARLLAAVFAITHVTVIDPAHGTLRRDRDVVIERGRIAAVTAGGQARLSADAERVDGTGRFLIPGLCDMHIHSGGYEAGRRMARLLVANGITCARDMGSPPEEALRLRDEIRSGELLGPRLVVAGPLLQTSLPPAMAANAMLMSAGTAAQAREAVRSLRAAGIDFLKVDDSVPREAYFAMARESHRLGIPFAGHLPPAITAWEAARARQASIEHLGGHFLGVLLACSSREADLTAAARGLIAAAVQAVWEGKPPDEAAPFRSALTAPVVDSFDPQKAASLMSLFRHERTWQTPTLVTLQRSWRSMESELTAVDRASGTRLLDRERALVRLMHETGVGLLAGTDLPLRGGDSALPDELAALVAAGLGPLDALKAATSGPAAFLHRSDAGVIREGALADLVLLEGDPLQDIANVRKIAAVVVAGKLVRAGELSAIRHEGRKE
jgi:hypothetical protein